MISAFDYAKIIKRCAEVVELADATDSKSVMLIACAGSSPAFGTNKKNSGFILTVLFIFSQKSGT